jgi:large subunit ribosomal protein L31
MKENTHPKYVDTTISCTCGTVYNTRSTSANINVGICAACHPYFTGEQRFIDTAGRVEKFAKRFGGSTLRRTKPKLAGAGA